MFAAVTGAVILLAPGATENAAANGDTRTIHLHHAHTQESIDATFMVDGRYDPTVLEKLNWFLRDWRRDEPTHMDPKLFDTIWEVYRESGSRRPIDVMSAYRSPETNSMLRHASRSVAEHSQHILGKAMDQHYEDVPMSRIREIAMRLQRGGVGFYPTAGTPFVHMDVGGVRHWPRMSYDQLSRLFPDGKTVHIPANGQPLAGYEQARAELEARGDSFEYPTAGEVKSKGFFAWLFGGGGEEEGDGEAASSGGGRRDSAPAPRRGASQVASLDRSAVGSTPADAGSGSDKNAGVHLFSFFDSKPAEPAPAVAVPASPAGRRGQRGRTQVASLPPAQPTAAEAQQTLAAEMQRQQQVQAAAEAEKSNAEAERNAAAVRQQQAAAQAQASLDARSASQLQAQADAQVRSGEPVPGAVPQKLAEAAVMAPLALASSGKIEVPLPPRRPVELASLGPAAPVPPSRPGEIASRSDHAPPPGLERVAVAALAPPSGRVGLPAAITQGLGQAAPPARVLAFASPLAAPPPVPLPVSRPAFVAARLDRSNFRALTGTTPAERIPSRAGVGSAVSALRPAAQASAGSLAGDGDAGSRRGFGARATDLSTDRFSGAAVAPQARVSTANLRRPHAATADD